MHFKPISAWTVTDVADGAAWAPIIGGIKHMKVWQTIKHPSWLLRIIYFVFALYLIFGLIVTLVWFEFGRSAEDQSLAYRDAMLGFLVFIVMLLGVCVLYAYRTDRAVWLWAGIALGVLFHVIMMWP
jgi:hypothetical protein